MVLIPMELVSNPEGVLWLTALEDKGIIELMSGSLGLDSIIDLSPLIRAPTVGILLVEIIVAGMCFTHDLRP
tara:strand:- start:27 stop:242 length:216 start_codon:yes stop_codon:yes gene_type:complete